MVRRISIPALIAAAALATVAAARDTPALRAVEADQARREADLASARASADAAGAEAARLEGQLQALNAAQAGGQRGISERRLALAGLAAEERDLEARLGGDRARLSRLLGALELFRRDPPPALFVPPRDVLDAVRAAILIRAVSPELQARAQALKGQIQTLRAVRRQVQTTSADILIRESDLSRRRAEIEALIARQSQARRQADAAAETARQDIADLARRARSLRDLARGVTAAAPPAGSGGAPDPEHAGPGGRPAVFLRPVAGRPARRFGALEPGGERSEGWTWRAAPNADVRAPAQGVVDYAGPLKGWGLVLILRLGGGYHLVLAGLETVAATPGRMVMAGQTVGRMPGDAPAGSNLYLEIRKNGAPVDPARWLAAPPGGPGER